MKKRVAMKVVKRVARQLADCPRRDGSGYTLGTLRSAFRRLRLKWSQADTWWNVFKIYVGQRGALGLQLPIEWVGRS